MKHMHAQGGPRIAGHRARHAALSVRRRLRRGPRRTSARAPPTRSRSASSRSGPENVAAFVGEPVQGAGGVIIPPADYWPRVEAICRKYGILLVCDEVICGFGRLGRWFGFQHFGVTPDLVSMAKGLSSGYLPISAVGVADHIVETIARGRRRLRPRLHLFGPSHLRRRGAEEHRDHRARGPGRAHRRRHRALSGRGAGTPGRAPAGRRDALARADRRGGDRRPRRAPTSASAAAPGKAGPIVRDLCIENGLMVRAVRDTIVMSPPLVITHAEIDRLVGTIERSLTQATPKLAAL